MKTNLKFGLIFWAFSSPGIASTPTLYVLAKPCRISIASVKSTGERQDVQFTTRFRRREECRQLAALHEPNFEGVLVRSKKVSYEWNTIPKAKKSPKFIRGYSRVTPKKMKPVLAKFKRR